ncbi:protein mab-21-like 2 [Striga asiatica]|uniref:Protein mab-21-like 2 n=1 Tax=Striga asiatica TaxID=4170 RepID=A0A5A7PFD8_STRAF|nr:protein mab-21-like 2 [Striga asiatica]
MSLLPPTKLFSDRTTPPQQIKYNMPLTSVQSRVSFTGRALWDLDLLYKSRSSVEHEVEKSEVAFHIRALCCLSTSLESCVKHTSTVPPLSTAVVRLEILRLLSPEETAVGKGCGRDGSTAVEIERQSPEKGCGCHTFSDGRRGWSSIWWWPGSLCVPPESDAAEMERWL